MCSTSPTGPRRSCRRPATIAPPPPTSRCRSTRFSAKRSDALSARLTKAFEGLNVNLDEAVHLKVDRFGNVSTEGPWKAKIEKLFADDPELAKELKAIAGLSALKAAQTALDLYNKEKGAPNSRQQNDAWVHYNIRSINLQALNGVVTLKDGKLRSAAVDYIDMLADPTGAAAFAKGRRQPTGVCRTRHERPAATQTASATNVGFLGAYWGDRSAIRRAKMITCVPNPGPMIVEAKDGGNSAAAPFFAGSNLIFVGGPAGAAGPWRADEGATPAAGSLMSPQERIDTSGPGARLHRFSIRRAKPYRGAASPGNGDARATKFRGLSLPTFSGRDICDSI